jgi:hypothetical protein
MTAPDPAALEAVMRARAREAIELCRPYLRADLATDDLVEAWYGWLGNRGLLDATRALAGRLKVDAIARDLTPDGRVVEVPYTKLVADAMMTAMGARPAVTAGQPEQPQAPPPVAAARPTPKRRKGPDRA